MQHCSTEGVKLLRSLALAVRSEQDFQLTKNPQTVVGAYKSKDISRSEATDVKRSHGYEGILREPGFTPMTLRQALNKIAHADPASADFYVAPSHASHDLLLYGEERGQQWFAAVSLLQLIAAVRALPDAKVQ